MTDQPRQSNPADALARLLEIMTRLRDPVNGCPWDLEQNFATIAPYTIEEAYEVAEAAEAKDLSALKEELGDLLLQVVFHAQMAQEIGAFDFTDVAETISNKMVSRHPHVFGDASIADAEEQTRAWEARKAQERASKAAAAGLTLSVLEGVSLALPALLRAEKLQKRASRVGFDWNDPAPILDKIAEELDELSSEMAAQPRNPDRLEDEMGDVLFACANLARHLGVDPEAALRRTNRKFERRFRRIEALLRDRGIAPDQAGLDLMEHLWQQAKSEERQS